MLKGAGMQKERGTVRKEGWKRDDKYMRNRQRYQGHPEGLVPAVSNNPAGGLQFERTTI